MEITRLERVAADLIANSLAPSTQRTYKVGQTEYLDFCTHLSVPPAPASEAVLIFFVAHLSLQLSLSSVRSYLSAVQHLHVAQGFGDPTANALCLQLALRGLKRAKPKAKDTRLPITPYVLWRIMTALAQEPHKQDNIMLWGACCLGVLVRLHHQLASNSTQSGT